MITVETYGPERKSEWNAFIARSKNGMFLFDRNYMEYHQDRFDDCSLMFYKDERLIATLPAHLDQDTLYSHEGLTFGGIISGMEMRAVTMLDIFSELLGYAKQNNIKKIRYKSIPYIFHTIPAEEDRYALFINKASLYRRDLSFAINISEPLRPLSSRTRGIRKAQKAGLDVRESDNIKEFWDILGSNLMKRYGTKPVHSYEEIKLLKDRFPDEIRFFSCYKEDQHLGGVVIYASRNVAHIQYVANSEQGRQMHALDLIVPYLITTIYFKKRYLSLGVSTEQQGWYLNRNLSRYKESYGSGAVVHDFYELKVR